MGAELPYQICEIGSICRMWRNTQNTHLPCSPISIHIFLAEGDCTHCRDSHCANISIHTFLAEGDTMILRMAALNCNFNPHLPCGRWRLLYRYSFLLRNFNPHLPCRRWRKQDVGVESYTEFQSTPSSRKVTRQQKQGRGGQTISIHTFLAEGDLLQLRTLG